MRRNKVHAPSDVPLVQWANGRVEARLPDQPRFSGLVGWHCEAGRFPEFDAWSQEGRMPEVEIRHQRPGGQAEVVRHWLLGESILLYPMTEGPVAATVALAWSRWRAATIRAGIGLRWEAGAAGRSRLALRGYLAAQAPTGEGEWVLFPGLVQITARSHMTDALLAALVDHVRVCESADDLIDRRRHPEPVAPVEVALPLGPGDEARWGKTATAVVVPLRSLHPPTIERGYLRAMWRPDEVAARAATDWEGVLAWAEAFAAGADGALVGFDERAEA